MNNVKKAIKDMHQLDELVARNTFMTAIHPVVKLLVTLFYIVLVVSFSKYNLTGVLGMVLYLVFIMELGEVSFRYVVRQLRVLFGILFLVGIANPFFDREVVAHWGNFAVTGGMISCVTLYLKGIFSLVASYVMIATTGMEQICYALQTLHMPKVITTVIMLIYRYIMLFLKEVDRISLAYSMRAPKQKGIGFKAWGSLAGAMLLRSVDRSERVYESMALRGFHGTFQLKGKEKIQMSKSIVYFIVMIGIIVVLRSIPILELAGGLVI